MFESCLEIKARMVRRLRTPQLELRGGGPWIECYVNLHKATLGGCDRLERRFALELSVRPAILKWVGVRTIHCLPLLPIRTASQTGTSLQAVLWWPDTCRQSRTIDASRGKGCGTCLHPKCDGRCRLATSREGCALFRPDPATRGLSLDRFFGISFDRILPVHYLTRRHLGSSQNARVQGRACALPWDSVA